MDRYQKVERPKPESPINENDIRITSQGLVRNYINYALTLLQVFLSISIGWSEIEHALEVSEGVPDPTSSSLIEGRWQLNN
ncbi:hypothetical protein OROMI_012861 [Orobanche minor]